jgi:hypothetical protein
MPVSMPSQAPQTFDAWSQANGRAQTLPLSVLKDTILGIDTHYYLQKALTSQLKEPLVSALGGFPFSLKTTIQQDLYEMREAGIKPIFVFSGISLAPIEKPFLTPDDSAKLRTRAWELYDKGQAMDAVEAFGQAGVIHATELFRATMRILRDRNVDFQVAPYAAWPQVCVSCIRKMLLYPSLIRKSVVGLSRKEGLR